MQQNTKKQKESTDILNNINNIISFMLSGKKADPRSYVMHYYIYIKFQLRQNQIWVIEIKSWLLWGFRVDWKRSAKELSRMMEISPGFIEVNYVSICIYETDEMVYLRFEHFTV